MKNIEITPEWILSGYVFEYYADGKGVVSFFTYTFSDSAWVSLALRTLGINYETYGNDSGTEVYGNLMNLEWEFNLEDIKECKDLYKELKRLDIIAQEKIEKQVRSSENLI